MVCVTHTSNLELGWYLVLKFSMEGEKHLLVEGRVRMVKSVAVGKRAEIVVAIVLAICVNDICVALLVLYFGRAHSTLGGTCPSLPSPCCQGVGRVSLGVSCSRCGRTGRR
jgi:hypothetical protein